ncbi:MAG: hypothetical protein DRP34_04365 [Thermodesulfobacteriota bacterium]|nr:MAG: hypothetical protein DRP34_04365 [Thermodesulfobacteriota bacterium]
MLKSILTGVCSIDKLDYLKRDAYHAGTPEYAIIDYYRVLNSLTYYPQDPYLVPVFKKKALYALEGVILSYFYMYRAVYYHHAVRAAYLLFQNIIWEAFEKYDLQKDIFQLTEPDFWNSFDDYKFINLLYSKSKLCSKLNRFLYRKLPKQIKGIREANIGRIYEFFRENPSYKEKVSIEKKITNELKEKYSGLEMILLDSPHVIPYPRSIYAAQRINVWDENLEHEPENIGKISLHLLNLSDVSEKQAAARVYVYPGEMRKMDSFIKDLNSVIMKSI